MIHLSPHYDVAVTCLAMGLNLHFAEIPDLQIVNELYALGQQHKGIEIPDDRQNQYGFASSTPSKSSRLKKESDAPNS